MFQVEITQIGPASVNLSCFAEFPGVKPEYAYATGGYGKLEIFF